MQVLDWCAMLEICLVCSVRNGLGVHVRHVLMLRNERVRHVRCGCGVQYMKAITQSGR